MLPFRASACVSLIVASLLAGVRAIVAWPPVLPVHKTYTFAHLAQSKRDTPARMFVMGIGGDTLYRIECHNNNYDNTYDMTYSGDFQCGLWAWARGEITTGDLFADSSKDQQTSDWLVNRGRMLALQLSDQCSTYPEYGLVRHFRTRGMLVTLQFGDLRWSASSSGRQLDEFTVDISVAPDPSAVTATSETIPEKMPPRGCGW